MLYTQSGLSRWSPKMEQQKCFGNKGHNGEGFEHKIIFVRFHGSAFSFIETSRSIACIQHAIINDERF